MKYALLLLFSLPLWAVAQQDAQHIQHYNQGVKAHNAGDYATAIKCYEKCIALNPQYQQARDNIGAAYYNQSINAYNEDNYTQSIRFAEKALKYAPKSADIYAILGNNHQRTKDYPAALIDFTHAIEVSPEPAAYYAARSWVYNDLLDNAKRLADMEKAAKLEPTNAAYQFYAGKYKQDVSEEKFKTAIHNYNAAIELDPNYRDAYIERGAYYMTFGNFQKALVDLHKAEELGADVKHLVEAAEYELKALEGED